MKKKMQNRKSWKIRSEADLQTSYNLIKQFW